MNGVHDMGGMHGFGPIVIEEHDGPMHLSAWEKRVNTLLEVTMRSGVFNIDAFRYGIELMPPAEYLATPYFGRWAHTIEWNLIREGIITRDELDAWTERIRREPAAAPAPAAEPYRKPEPTPGAPLPAREPRFSVRDVVRTRNYQPTSHHRMPRYVRGKQGVVTRINPPEPFPDLRADNIRAPLEVTYHVQFRTRDLWGESAEPDGYLSIDLSDSYLEPSPGGDA